MARTVNIHEAKTHLSRLLVEVQTGGEIIIAKAGRPVARLLPAGRRGHVRVPGSARKGVEISGDFLAPLPAEILDAFEPPTH